MKKTLLTFCVALVAAISFSIAGCGDDADCDAGAEDKCTTEFTSCTTACALSGDQACADQCATDKCACLDNAGCECNE